MKGELTNKEFAALLKAQGYSWPEKLASGEWAGIRQFMFTWGLCVGLDKTGYRTRFCYEDITDALFALATWDGHGDPPGLRPGRGGTVASSPASPCRCRGLPGSRGTGRRAEAAGA